MAAVKHPAGENQHTKRREAKQSAEQHDAWRERVEVGQLMEDLLACFNDPTRPKTASQIKAAEIVLDRFVPRLSSTEAGVVKTVVA